MNIDFASGTLPTGVTLTRASTGTYFDIGGIMQTAAINVARFESGCLLYERQSTNLLLQSGGLLSTGGAWLDFSAGITTLTPNYAVAPDGTTTASRLQGNNVNTYWSSNYRGPALSNGKTFTQSVWMKANTGVPTGVRLRFLFNGGAIYNSPDLTITSSMTRFQLARALSGSDTQSFAATLSINNGNDLSAWGAQMEEGDATSYIPTTTAAATRSADVCSFTIPGGVSTLRYVFDNDSTQDVSVSPGAYTIPTNLNRSRIKRIVSL